LAAAYVTTDHSGDQQDHFSPVRVGKVADMRSGTAAVPTAGAGPMVKLTQTEKITDLATQMNSIPGDNESNAALHVHSFGVTGSLGQTNAILATAKGAPSGTDVCALAAWGRVTAGTGTGFGGYFEGRRDVSGARAIGAEIRVQNEGAADGAVNATGAGDTLGVWVTTSSTGGYKSGAGVSLGTTDSSKFKVGYHVTAGAVFNHGFRDESGSQISFLSLGTHNSGIDISAATFSDYAIKLPSGTTSAANGINFGADAFIFRSLAGQLTMDTPGGLILNGGTTAGIKIGTLTTQKVGFFGTTPIAKPTGVAVTSAGIHAALVSLGIIAA